MPVFDGNYKVNQIENTLKVYPERLGLSASAFAPGRGAISGFSKFSSSRLNTLILSMELKRYFSTFITLTYSGMPDVQEAKKQLNVFLTRLRRDYPGCFYLWVQEFQQRGAIHFHLLVSPPIEKLPFQKKRLRDDDGKIYTQFILKRGWWPWGFTTLGRVEYEGGLSKYLSKEIQKRNQKRIVTFAGRWWGASRNLVERGLWIVPGEQMEPLEGRGRGDLSRVWFGDLRDFKTLEGFKHICQNNPECSKEYAEKMKAIRHSRGESFQELRNRIMGVK